MGGRAVTTRISSPASTTVLYPCLLVPLLAPLLAPRFGKTSTPALFAACTFASKLKASEHCEGTSISARGRRGSSKASASRSRKATSAKRAAKRLKRKERGWRPKRALGSYMFFCKDQHANVTADNPNIPFTEVGRILGAQWQQMSEKDKKPYIKKAEADKKRYAKELKRCK